jgi:hypothetical protein
MLNKWFRDYTSVLTKEFYVLYGSVLGLTIGVCSGLGFYFFKGYFHGILDDPYRLIIFWGALGVSSAVLGRVILMLSAYVVRKRSGLPVKKSSAKGAQGTGTVFQWKSRIVAWVFLVLILLADSLAKSWHVSPLYRALFLQVGITGYSIWYAFFRQNMPLTKLKRGSLAEKMKNGSRTFAKVMAIVLVLELIFMAWISLYPQSFFGIWQ